MGTATLALLISAAAALFSAIYVLVFYRFTGKQMALMAREEQHQNRSSLDQLSLLNYQNYFQYQWNKRVAALSYSLTVNKQASDAFDRINHYFGPLLFRSEPVSREELEKGFEEDDLLYTSVIIFLSHYERLATAISADVADDRTAFEFMGETVVFYVRTLHAFIDMRKEVHRHPRSYIYLEDLVARWQKRLEEPRSLKPFEFDRPELGPPPVQNPHLVVAPNDATQWRSHPWRIKWRMDHLRSPETQ